MKLVLEEELASYGVVAHPHRLFSSCSETDHESQNARFLSWNSVSSSHTARVRSTRSAVADHEDRKMRLHELLHRHAGESCRLSPRVLASNAPKWGPSAAVGHRL